MLGPYPLAELHPNSEAMQELQLDNETNTLQGKFWDE
jgi:hypothetical protein